MQSKSWVGSYLTLVPSSTRMPQRTHRGWPDTIPYNIHKEVRYHPTQQHTKLHSLRDPIKSRMCQYTTQTCSVGPDDQSLTDKCGGYHLEALNFRSYHSSSFPSSIHPFPLIAPPGLQLCQSFDHPAKPHRTSIDPTTRLLPIAYRAKHIILSLYFFHRGKQSGLVRVILVQPRFH
jgi:hypothetical protein